MQDMKQFDEFIQTKGYSLLGVAEVGLTLKDALSAVVLAKEAGLSILGGDVYLLKDGKTIPAYANWYSDRRKEESINDYAKRTWQETEDYLQRFPKHDDAEVLFALVVSRG
jgi:hypothetical protein